jgi:phage terminase large subunit-like protein
MDYSQWVRDGHIFTTPGTVIDHEYIANFISQEVEKYDFRVLGFDARMAYHGTIQRLLNNNIDCQPFSQSLLNVSEPTKELERLTYARELEHFNNPVLKWMLSNITLRKDAQGNYMIDKGKSQGKIDGFAALINCIGTHQRFPATQSVYATRGVITI